MRNVAAAIEFGTSKVICVIGREKSIGRFEVLGTGVASYEGIKNSRWQKSSNVEEAAAKALEIAERRAKKRVREAYVSVPGVFCKVICREGMALVKNGVVTVQDVERMIDDAEDFYVDPNYTVISSTPVYFLLDDGNRHIDVVGSVSKELKGLVSFILAKTEYVREITKMLSGLDVKTRDMIPEMLAESLFLVPVEERDASSVLLNVGYYDTNVTVVYGDAIVYNKTIHAGGMHLTNDLCLVMNIDVDTAEQVKKRYCFGLENSGTKLYDYAKDKTGRMQRFNHALVSEIVDARVEHLCELICEVFQSSPLTIARRTRVYLSGGGLSMLNGVKDILQKYLKRQVRISRVDAPQLSTPNYYVALSMLDYIFESEYTLKGFGGKSLLERLSDKMFD